MKQQESAEFARMKAGQPYHFDDYLLQLQKKAAKKLAKINRLPYGSARRERLLATLFAHYGERTVLKEEFRCNFGFNITIGDACYINYGVCLLDSYRITIGNNVFLGPNVVITAVTHPNEAALRRNLIAKQVVLEDDVWIGANAVILPGVTVHRGAIVGAGAVVLRDVPEDTVVGGVPAEFLKTVAQKK